MATDPAPAVSKKSLTAVLHGVQCLVCEDRPCPPPQSNEVQIRVVAVGVCGSDLAYWRDGMAGGVFPIPFPRSVGDGYRGQMGHEVSGAVQCVGCDVSTLQVGDRVALEPGVPCGSCRPCLQGRYNLCPAIQFIGSFVNRRPGALTQLFNHRAAFCHKLPDTVPTEEGALLEPLSVAINAVRRGGVGLGSTVLVTGAGTVGLLACMVARAAGATTVVCTDPVATKRRLATSLGVSAALAPCPVTDAVLHTHGGAGFDVCIECSGAEAALKLCVEASIAGGCVVVVANQHGPCTSVPLQSAARREVDIRGVYRYKNTYQVATSLAATRRVLLKPLISHRFDLKDASLGFQTLATGQATKVLICPNGVPEQQHLRSRL